MRLETSSVFHRCSQTISVVSNQARLGATFGVALLVAGSLLQEFLRQSDTMPAVFSKLQVALATSTAAAVVYYHKHLKNANRSSFEWKYFDYHPACVFSSFARNLSLPFCQSLSVPGEGGRKKLVLGGT